jgi:predicted PurR-regulated permease PerM
MTLPIPESDESATHAASADAPHSLDGGPAPTSAARTVFVVLLLISIALVASVAAAIWQPIVLGAAIAATLVRYYERLAIRLKGRKTLAAAIMTAGVLFLVVIPLGGLVSFLVVQGTQAVKVVTDLIRSSHGFEDLIGHLPVSMQNLVHRLTDVIPISFDQLSDQLAAGSRWAATTVGSLLSKTSTLLFDLALTLIAFYVFLTDGPNFVRWLACVLPLKERQTYELFHDFRMMSKAVIGSNVIVGALQSLIASIAYFIAPIPHPAFFGLLTFIASFVPSIGTAIVTVPLTVLMFIIGKPLWGLAVGIWTIGLVGGVDNIVRPLLLRGAGHIHGAVVFFSLIGGIAVFGPIGLIVGPLALTFVLAMVRLWQRDFNPQTRRSEAS